MNIQIQNDRKVIQGLRQLWRKRAIPAALIEVEKIQDEVARKIWKATILIAKAELAGSADALGIDLSWFDAIDLHALPQETQIDIELVKGRIAIVLGDFAQAETYFFEALLKSRTVDYLLGKVQSMVGLGQVKLLNNHFEQAYDLSITAASLAEKLSETNREYVETEVLLLQCHIHLNEQDYVKLAPKAEELYERSKVLDETLKFVHAQNHIAIVHSVKGDYKLALPYFLEALDTCKKIDYQSLAIKIATNIATMHGQLHNYNEALDRYHSILDEYQAPIRPEKRAVMFNNIGNLYVRLGKWKEAIAYFLDAEKIADEKEYLPLKRLAFSQIARCLIESESYDAFITHMKSEDYFDGRPTNGLQIMHYVKSKYALSQKKYEDAIRWGEQAIDVAQDFGDDTTILQAQELLAQAYEESGDLAAALNIFKEYTKKKEVLEKERVKNMIVNTEIDFILAAKEKEIRSLQRENQLQSELINSTSLIRKKNKELLAKNEELSYFARMIAVDFNKHLRVIQQFVQILEQKLPVDKQEEEYWGYVNRAVDKVSNLVDGLHKYALVMDDDSLAGAVGIGEVLEIVEYDLAALIQENQAQIQYASDWPTLQCGKTHLVKIFKELIYNALRFSSKGVVIQITSREEDDGHVFQVQDNGVGIPEGDEQKIFWAFYRSGRLPSIEGNGLGLAACKKIVENYNGVISATLPEDGGLCINIFWPKDCKSSDSV